MSEEQEILTAQGQAIDGAIETVGLAGDLLGGVASTVGNVASKVRDLKKSPDQSPNSTKPDTQKTQSQYQTQAVLDSNDMDFTQGQIPIDLGISELKGVDPTKISKFDRDIAISWGMALSDVNSVNQGRRSIGADMQAFKEPERVENIAKTKESLQALIKEKGYTNEQLLKIAGAKVDVDAALKTIDNNPTHPDSKLEQASVDNAPAKKQEQPSELSKQDSPNVKDDFGIAPASSENISESPAKENLMDLAALQLNVNSGKLNPEVTARTPKQAKAEVQKLGKGIESGLGKILKSKVEVKIYSASRLVYPPKNKTKITPETSDKLNRAFTDPSSVKGTITLSIRTEEGKLKPIYQVSNGKIKLDTYGLKNSVSQDLPQLKQFSEAKLESSSQKAEPKSEPKHEAKSNLNSSSEKKQAQTPSEKKARPEDVIKAQDSALDAADRVIEAQANKILELEKRIERLEKIESSLKQSGVPQGITEGVNHANRTLGQRFRLAAKELAVTTGAAAISGASHVIKTASDLISKAEAAQVYKSGKFIVSSVGMTQPDGSKKFTGKELDLKLHGENLIVSNKAGKVLFQGNSKTQGMSPKTSMSESMKVKQVAFAAQQLKSKQQQRQQQSQKQAVGGVKR